MSTEDEEWELEMRMAEGLGTTRAWALSSELPDPTYNSKFGWALDQFAMSVAPDLLTEYKQRLHLAFKHKTEKEERHYNRKKSPIADLERDAELAGTVKNHLLQDRYRVMGFPPGSYHPEIIPRALLQDMQPNIILSELRELTSISPRRYQKVRVFDEKRSTKGTAGTKPTYNWPTLKTQLEKQKTDIFTMAELVNYCRKNVKPYPGKIGSPDGPDDNTVRGAIKTHGLRRFIKPLP